MNTILDICCLAAVFARVERYTLRLAQELERDPEIANPHYFSQLSFLTQLPSANSTTRWMAKMFSWQRAANATADVYQKLLA